MEVEDVESEEEELEEEELEVELEVEEVESEEEELEEEELEVEVEVEDVESEEEELEEEVELGEEVELEEEKAEEEEEGGPSPSSSSSSSSSSLSSSCSVLILVPLEEGSAAARSPSPPQSPRSTCPSPSAMAGAPGSQSHQGSSSPDEEGSSTWGAPAGAQASLPDALRVKVAGLVLLLLLKYRTKQPTTRAEMLAAVSQDDRDRFPVIFRRACEYLQLVFGVDVKEVDPREHSYVLVSILGLSCDGTPSGRDGMPKTSLLVLVLWVILLEDDRAPEEAVWEALGVMGVYAGREHVFYGEPRELLTEVWVQEGYLEYRQVPGSEPARYEFLWGPRAHAETSGVQVLQHILAVNSRQPGSPCLSEEAVSHEEERA
ncbi:LOW QUALITY PROTEIN: melanoma-associated antigen 9-like [Neofelis nebulosa]|uniref:LOW QUALITY PROTEIN: melanoma-associated antigen 9-like n=1 Tax=Neofelis nebulosa TaxID=61452 RepID=UPI00272CF3DA|nr:LOW QUALITY PROTEIN: melanoma-associated antigen 9-like [Neofelis nebulosa]XP_058569261.1 LOW QUALITY PROTEIN: melanoma-associated antigen 9-like [Neofelis nebulosa]